MELSHRASLGRAYVGPRPALQPDLLLVVEQPGVLERALPRAVDQAFQDAMPVALPAAPEGTWRTAWETALRVLEPAAPELRCVRGPHANHLLTLAGQPAHAIAALRDPDDFAVDRFQWLRYAQKAVSGSLADLLGEIAGGPPDGAGSPAAVLFNGQARALLAPHHDVSSLATTLGPPSDADMWRERLAAIVEEHYTVGRAEALGALLRLLERKFAFWSVEHPPEDRPPLVSDVLDKRTRRLVQAANWLDRELYADVAARFPARDGRRRGCRIDCYFGEPRAEDEPILVWEDLSNGGSTTLKHLVAGGVGDAERRHRWAPDGLDVPSLQAWYADWFGELAEDERAALRLVSGRTAALALDELAAEACCVVADPVIRTIARYADEHENDPPLAPDVEPDDPWRWRLEDVFVRLGGGTPADSLAHRRAADVFNGQARALLAPFYDTSALAYSAGPAEDAAVWRERLRRTLDAHYIADATERLSQLVDAIAERYDWPVEADTTYGGEPTDGVAIDLAPAAIRPLIRSYNWLDAELHELVQTKDRPVPVVKESKTDFQYSLSEIDADASESTRTFAALTNDRNVGAAFDVRTDSTELLIAFGGLAGHLGMPIFEFFTLTRDLDIKKVYLRDQARAWYHAGVESLGADVPAVAAALRDVIDSLDVDRVVMAGNSSGGWGALLFGALVGVDVALAFSPQTVIANAELQAAGDDRWDQWLERMAKDELVDERFLDLVPILASPVRSDTVFEVHYPGDFALDVFHAERLAGLPGVDLVNHPGVANHGVIRRLKTSGRLSEILQAALQPQ